MRLHDIAFYFSAFFILGVGLASLKVNIWVIIFTYTLLAGLNLYFKKDWNKYLIAPILFVGFFYYNFYAVLEVQNIPYNKQLIFEGIIIRDPKYGLEYQELDIELQKPWRGKVHVYVNLYPEYNYGDLLEFDGRISKSPSGKTISGFPKIKLLEENKGSSFKTGLFSIKDRLVENIQKVLPSDKSALASGILLGERAEFSEALKDAMRKSGTTHIVALSGFNISIIGILLADLLIYAMSRRRAFYVSLFTIICFVLMTGAEPSVVRAAFMGVIALIAQQSSRIYNFRNAIIITALVMLIFDPTLLIFDVGFQFSFLALLGLVYIEPLIRKIIISKHNNKDKAAKEWKEGWRKNLLQTFSAQIAVAPIALYVFGYLSPFSLISNVLILQLIPMTMFFAFIVAVSGFLSYGLSLAISWVLSALLGYEIFIINLFSFNWL